MRTIISKIFFLWLLIGNFSIAAEYPLLSELEKLTSKEIWHVREYSYSSDQKNNEASTYFLIYKPVDIGNGFCFTRTNKVSIKKSEKLTTLNILEPDVDYLINNYYANKVGKSCSELDFQIDYFRVKSALDTVRLSVLYKFINNISFLQSDLKSRKIYVSEIELFLSEKNYDFNYSISFNKADGDSYLNLVVHPVGSSFQIVEENYKTP
ncbi:MAG: hypothetical protein Q7T48_20435 [Cellvibrio sp.]|uniref:hypothetical protein n=1 Tax=Cellvibrio sp. TaxID=1965322 RepID=UPI00271B71A4|nr:hypothetical protein [Cellvibrio sp.]